MDFVWNAVIAICLCGFANQLTLTARNVTIPASQAQSSASTQTIRDPGDNVTVPSLIIDTVIKCDSNLSRDQANDDQPSFIDSLLKGMNPQKRPALDQREWPVEVKVGIHVLSIGTLSEEEMEYQLDIYFRQTWTDGRLAYNLSDLGPSSRLGYFKLGKDPRDLIWVPDLFFPFEKQASFHDITTPNIMVNIYPSGEVMYSMRLTLVITCKMKLSSFPMDNQNCPFDIESYSYETTEMNLMWADIPVTIEEPIELPQFSLQRPIKTLVCTKEYYTGRFPCLRAKFELQRFFGDHLLHTYIPSGLIVILSWVAFWINKDAIPARISLSIVTVMTLVSHIAGAKTSIPSVTYLKAVDVWMMMAMVFVFAAVIEYAFVNSLDRQAMKAKQRTGRSSDKASDEESDQNQTAAYADHAKKVDKASRIAFPVAFILFNIIYWPYYTRTIPSE